MTRKKKLIYIAILLLLVIDFLFNCMRANVMERICNAGTGKINRVTELEEYDSEEWNMVLETFGAMSIDYRKEMLKDNVEIHLLFFHSKEKVNVTTNVYLSDEILLNIYTEYDCEKEKLIYRPIEIVDVSAGAGNGIFYHDEESINQFLQECGVTRREVEKYQKYALYDVVVRTWIKANGGIGWLERMKLESCTVDNTFNFDS